MSGIFVQTYVYLLRESVSNSFLRLGLPRPVRWASTQPRSPSCTWLIWYVPLCNMREIRALCHKCLPYSVRASLVTITTQQSIQIWLNMLRKKIKRSIIYSRNAHTGTYLSCKSFRVRILCWEKKFVTGFGLTLKIMVCAMLRDITSYAQSMYFERLSATITSIFSSNSVKLTELWPYLCWLQLISCCYNNKVDDEHPMSFH